MQPWGNVCNCIASVVSLSFIYDAMYIVSKRCVLEQKLLLTANIKTSYQKSIGTKINDLDHCLKVAEVISHVNDYVIFSRTFAIEYLENRCNRALVPKERQGVKWKSPIGKLKVTERSPNHLEPWPTSDPRPERSNSTPIRVVPNISKTGEDRFSVPMGNVTCPIEWWYHGCVTDDVTWPRYA